MNKVLKDIEGNVIMVDPSSLPAASTTAKGTVIIGDGLSIDKNGVVSATNTNNTVTVGQSAPNVYSTEYNVGDWVIDIKALYAYMCYIPASVSQRAVTGSSWIKIPYEKYTGADQQQSSINNDNQ